MVEAKKACPQQVVGKDSRAYCSEVMFNVLTSPVGSSVSGTTLCRDKDQRDFSLYGRIKGYKPIFSVQQIKASEEHSREIRKSGCPRVNIFYTDQR